MPSPLGVLREWWREAYLGRGFGFLIPGYRSALRRGQDRLERLYGRLSVAYPEGWYIAVYRGIPIVAPSREGIENSLRRLLDRDSIPRWFLPDIPTMRF